MACEHKRGEYSDDYQHCLDCGREVVLIGGVWFVVDGWLRMSPALLSDEPSEPEQSQ